MNKERGGSLVSMICGLAVLETDEEKYNRIAKEELKETGRIRFRLTPHGGFALGITHWHLRHLRSNILWIMIGETGQGIGFKKMKLR